MISKNDGTSNYGNIITIAESAAQPGVLWVGTDDGNVQISRDGGGTWKNVSDSIPGLPRNTYQISRVAPSNFDAGTCYVSLDGHRYDDLKPYVFVTRDFGATWASIANNLPEGNVNVILEDPVNRNLLYLGTEYAFYVTLNGGKEWKRFMTGLPTVRIDDVIVHPRDNDLILGTHGRSIWIMDDVTPLQQLTENVMAQNFTLFKVRPATAFDNDIYMGRTMGGAKHFRGQNPPAGTTIPYYLKASVSGDVHITISDIDGRILQEMTGSGEAGLHRVPWPPTGGRGGGGGGGGAAGAAVAAQAGAPGARGAAPSAAQPAAPAGGGGGGRGFGGITPGTFRVNLTAGGKEYFTRLVVEPDPNR
jgi:hypothetical protein